MKLRVIKQRHISNLRFPFHLFAICKDPKRLSFVSNWPHVYRGNKWHRSMEAKSRLQRELPYKARATFPLTVWDETTERKIWFIMTARSWVSANSRGFWSLEVGWLSFDETIWSFQKPEDALMFKLMYSEYLIKDK